MCVRVEREGIGQRDFVAVVALEGRRQLVDHARAHPADDVGARLLQEGCEQEARKRPGKTEAAVEHGRSDVERSEEHTSELQSLMRISYAVFCLKKKKKHN